MIYCTAWRHYLNGFEPLGDLANTAVGHTAAEAKSQTLILNSRAFRNLPCKAVVVPLPRIATPTATPAEGEGS